MKLATRTYLTVNEVENIKHLLSNHLSADQIRSRTGRSESCIYKIGQAIKDGTYDKFLEHVREQEPTRSKWIKKGKAKAKQATAANRKQVQGRYLNLKRRAKVAALREQGMSVKEIAKKIGVGYSTAGYYITQLNKANGKISQAHSNGKESHEQIAASHNGNGNGTVNRNVLIGIAYAETDRFIGVLAERLSVPGPILRRELSGLLGRETIR